MIKKLTHTQKLYEAGVNSIRYGVTVKLRI